jgi:hypothetical protein
MDIGILIIGSLTVTAALLYYDMKKSSKKSKR